MNEDKKRKVSVFTVLIFILSGILVLYAIASFISATLQINEMVAMGGLAISGATILEIIGFYMTSSIQYIVYASILLAIWWTRCKCGDSEPEVEEDEEDTKEEDAPKEIESKTDDAKADDAKEDESKADEVATTKPEIEEEK